MNGEVSNSKSKHISPDPLPLAARLRSAEITLIIACASYEIWWFYKSQDTRDLDAMDEFPAFFLYDEEANFRSMIVSLYSLFDDHRDTLSIKSLIHEIDPYLAKPIWKKYGDLKGSAASVRCLRHNVIAHRNAAKSYDQVFIEANLRPDDLKALIYGTLDVLTLIANVLGTPEPSLSPFVRSDVAGLISRIRPD